MTSFRKSETKKEVTMMKGQAAKEETSSSTVALMGRGSTAGVLILEHDCLVSTVPIGRGLNKVS